MLDLSGLQQYTQDMDILIGKLLNRDTVLREFEPHTGYFPGPAVLRLYDAGGDLGECCEVPEGSGAFTQKLANVECILSGNEFCLEDLARYIHDAGMRFTAGRESAGSVEEVIMNQELAMVAKRIDTLVFQGDTTSSDPNLNKIDGLIKQATNSADTVKLTIDSGNIYTAIQQIITALPYDAYDLGDIDIYVGREVAGAFNAALIGLNFYNYNPGVRGIYDPISIPGQAGIRIVPTRGLDGTNTIIATPRRNIHWLTNLQNDYMEMFWAYTEYHQRYYWRIKFLLGVLFGVDEYVVIATLDPDVITAQPSLNVSVVSPLGANGGVLTTDTP